MLLPAVPDSRLAAVPARSAVLDSPPAAGAADWPHRAPEAADAISSKGCIESVLWGELGCPGKHAQSTPERGFEGTWLRKRRGARLKNR